MKKIVLTRIVSMLLLICTIALTAASCGKARDGASASTLDTKEAAYNFPEGADLGGQTYNILNCYKDQWEQICLVTSHEQTGEAVNDEIYKRTLWLQASLNCELKETNMYIYDLPMALNTDIDSGMNNYAVAYLQAPAIFAQLINGKLTQLDGISNMHLEEDYWSQELMKATTLNYRHYSAASDAHLMHFDGSWAVFFNLDILDAHGIEAPYNMVREGKWTLEEMLKLSRQTADLKGDESWSLNLDGNCVYGFSTHWTGIGMMLYGLDAMFGKKDVYDIPYLTCATNDFYNRAQDAADFCTESGTFYYATADNNKMDEKADALFIAGRSAFTGFAICMMSKLMKTDIEYGILPFPKYNEDQTDYNVSSSITATFMTIPSGYSQPEDIGLIMDAMSFEADRTLEDVYYKGRLELRANTGDVLSNIEMLNLIRERRSCDLMVISGLGDKLHLNMCYAVRNGGQTINSTSEQYRVYTESQIAKLKYFFGIQ